MEKYGDIISPYLHIFSVYTILESFQVSTFRVSVTSEILHFKFIFFINQLSTKQTNYKIYDMLWRRLMHGLYNV